MEEVQSAVPRSEPTVALPEVVLHPVQWKDDALPGSPVAVKCLRTPATPAPLSSKATGT